MIFPTTGSMTGWGGAMASAAIAIAVCISPMRAGEPAGAGTPAEVLLIANSASTGRKIMAFSASDGALIDPDFIVLPGNIGGVVPSRPLHAIASPWDTVLISDQLRHVVYEFNWDGSGASIFAPAGGPNNNILNNVRGMAVRDGQILVAHTGPSAITDNDHAIMQFDQNGDQVPSLIFQRYGGIRGPFDVLVLDDIILVCCEATNNIMRYTAEGKFNELFAINTPFPQQLARAANGNILVAVFSSPSRIAEFSPGGTLVGQYTAGLSGFRGVHELDNGNLLVTNGTGVHEITRGNQLVGTKFAGSEMRYIERVTLPEGVVLRSAADTSQWGRAKPPATADPRQAAALDAAVLEAPEHDAADERGEK